MASPTDPVSTWILDAREDNPVLVRPEELPPPFYFGSRSASRSSLVLYVIVRRMDFLSITDVSGFFQQISNVIRNGDESGSHEYDIVLDFSFTYLPCEFIFRLLMVLPALVSSFLRQR
jgi:hypothetical protein